MNTSVRLVALFAIACAVSIAAAPPPLRIAAAADLQTVFPTLTAHFEQQTTQTVSLSFGSSGNFYAQIRNGAPFDLFFSADADYPTRLQSEGLTAPGTLVQYATGRLALWSRNETGLDLSHGLSMLADPSVRHVAIANPEHAPYGRAAVAALMHEQLYDRVRPKFVLGENVSQAAQFVQSGNAEAGLIALSLVRGPAMRATGRYVEIPAAFHPPIEQAAVVLRTSRYQDAARQFLAFLQRPDSRRLLQEAGFVVPAHGR